MESAFKRGEKSVEDWLKRRSQYAAGDISAGIKEGNPSAASFMKFQAFTTAAVQDQRIRTRLQAAIAGNLKRGESYRDFRKIIDSEFDKAGLTRLKPYQVENIYFTNTSLAFGAGQIGRFATVADEFPFWQYSAVMDSHTRPSHAALDGKVFRNGDFTYWPPIGFRCRCTAIPLTARQAGRYLKTDMPTPEQRESLNANLQNAEFIGNKSDKYMKWLAKEYDKSDATTKKYIDKAIAELRQEVSRSQAEGLKQFFSNEFIAETWEKFRNNEGFTKAARDAGLSSKQAYFIHAYTLKAPLYDELNRYLFKEEMPDNFSVDQLLGMKRLLTSALKKLPVYNGVALRNVKELPNEILKQYQAGKIIVWDGFGSASTEPGHFKKNRIKFIIQSASSRNIGNLSRFQNQKETLFLPGSRFKVLKRYEKGQTTFIEMNEIQ